jgi:hypothetical protein
MLVYTLCPYRIYGEKQRMLATLMFSGLDKSLKAINEYIATCKMAEQLQPQFQAGVMDMLSAVKADFIREYEERIISFERTGEAPLVHIVK